MGMAEKHVICITLDSGVVCAMKLNSLLKAEYFQDLRNLRQQSF
jgi:hypothetical protein